MLFEMIENQFIAEEIRVQRFEIVILLPNTMDCICTRINTFSHRWLSFLKQLCKASHNYFKQLKQHLRIKKFWGTSENAVKIQVYTAITAYCLVAIMQHDMQLDRSTYEVLLILGLSLMNKTQLRDLFNKTKFNNVKDQSEFYGPDLFEKFKF